YEPMPGETPYDTDNDGTPDSEDQLRQYLAANPSVSPDALSQALVPATGGEGPDGEFFRGKPLPDWTGSFGGTLSFLGSFRLTTQFDYAFGNFHRQNLSGEFRQAHSLLGRNTREVAEMEAALRNPDASIDEKMAAAEQWSRTAGLDGWDGVHAIEEADYIRWREIGLTYQVPGSVIEGLGIDRMTVTAAGRNLKLWTDYSGIEPENNVVSRPTGDTENFVYGIDGWRPGVPARYTLTIRIGFRPRRIDMNMPGTGSIGLTKPNRLETGLLAAALAVATAGCDSLLELENPNNVVQQDLENAEAVTALVNGAVGLTSDAIGETALSSATLTDELLWTGSQNWRSE